MTVIEVFADVACPFTHVGIRRLVERRDRLGRADVRLHVRSWPLELVNGAPLDPGTVAEEVDELRAQVAPDLFAGFDRDRFPSSSLPALVLAKAAYDRGIELGEQVSLALRAALFEQGRDIADPEVLLDIAGAAGLDLPSHDARDAVIADWDEGKARGVVGSPHFFIGGAGWFCPSLDIKRVDGRLVIERDDDALESFLTAAFA